MRLEGKITVKLDQMDAAIAAVLLAETAGRVALDALIADKTAEIGGTTNKGSRALADAYIKVGQALAFAIIDASKNRGAAEHDDARPEHRARGSSCIGGG